MPRVAARWEQPPRRSASEASRKLPQRPSTPAQELSGHGSHRRSRSFSNYDGPAFDIAARGGGDGGEGKQRHHHQRPLPHLARDCHRRPQFHSKMVDIGCRGVGAGFGRWSTFSYDRLPEQQLRLTIVKLNGSSFDVHVAKSASVAELKLAVEEIFSGGSPRGGDGNISWSHVWGHFCLRYMNQKLTDNKASLRTFGIKDGDELHFVRHVSVNYNPIRPQQPRKNGASQEHQRT